MKLTVLPLLLLAVSVQADPVTQGDAADDAWVQVASVGFESDAVAEPIGPRPPVRVPRTEFDTAHRFNMDSGKKLTAAEFDAWLASMGARVVGAEATAAVDAEIETPVETVASTQAEPASPVESQPSVPAPLPAAMQPVKHQVVE